MRIIVEAGRGSNAGPSTTDRFFFKTPIVITPVSKPPADLVSAMVLAQNSKVPCFILIFSIQSSMVILVLRPFRPFRMGYMLSNMASGMASLIYPATRLQLLMSLLRLPQADVTLGHERWIISWEESWPPSLLHLPGIGRWGPTSKWELTYRCLERTWPYKMPMFRCAQ